MVISGIKISNEIIFSPVLTSCYRLPKQLVQFPFQLQAHPVVACSHFECHERKTLILKNAQTVTTHLLVFPTTLLRVMYCNGPPLKCNPAALSIQLPRNLVISNTSTFSSGRLLASLIVIIIHQESISSSQQLPCAHTTVFLQTSLFLDRFSREF